MFLLSQEY